MAQAKRGRSSEVAEQQVTTEMSLTTDAFLTRANEGDPSGAVREQMISALTPHNKCCYG